MPSLRVIKGVAREIQRAPRAGAKKENVWKIVSGKQKLRGKNNYGKVSRGLDETARTLD